MTEYKISLRIEKVTYGDDGAIVEIDPSLASRVLEVCEDEGEAREFFAHSINHHYR